MKAVPRGCTFVHCRPRLPRRLGRGVVANAAASSDFADYYDLLQVDADASASEIKANYRRLQKEHHPDVSGDEATSSVLNRAYQTLIDPRLRGEYDHRLASVPLSDRSWKRSFKDQPGVVGPLSEAEIVFERALKDGAHTAVGDGMEENVTWLREWAKTFIFAADLPLPLPLQCDEIDQGVRLAFIRTSKNCIRSAGELHFVVRSQGNVQNVTVYRIVPTSTCGSIPGEFRVMQAFSNALKSISSISTRGDVWLYRDKTEASAAAQMMPALVALPLERIRGSSYKAYHLNHSTN